MKSNFSKYALLAVAMLLTMPSFANDGMEEYFFESGKIKVVVVVATIVMVGLFVYIFRLERRLKKLENKK
jgi:CcmD family protein